MYIRIDFEGHCQIFQHPVKVFLAKRLDQIQTQIDSIEAYVNQGYYAVGYLAYESAAAFNSFNLTKPAQNNQLPLLLIGIFENYTTEDNRENNQQFDKLELTSNTTLDEYNQNINYIKQQIELGNTYQTNYTIAFNAPFKGDSMAFYHFLQQHNHANYCAYIRYEMINILSISPELFFKIDEHGVITTKPMKGTAARGVNNQDDVIKRNSLFSEKNQAENMMIVDLLRNDLSRISEPGSVCVTELFTAEKYPTVWQLTSTIQGKIKPNTPLFNIFQALFPCGSITGAPKASTMKIIANIESAPREVYCGTIGVIEPFMHKAIFNIPIRTLTIHDGQASYGVGGGITWDSTQQGEYNEILEKTAILNSTRSLPNYLLESLLLTDGELFLLDEHLKRLQNTAIYFDYPIEITEIQNQLGQLPHQYQHGSYKVRLCLMKTGLFTIEVTPITHLMSIDALSLAPKCVNSQNIYLYHKTAHRDHLPQIKAGEECLIYNEKNQLTEFVNGNVVLLINNQWLTPTLTSGLLPGIMRQYYINQGLISESSLMLNDIMKADKIAFINSVRKWVNIKPELLANLKTMLSN